jgi:hypothetical protein
VISDQVGKAGVDAGEQVYRANFVEALASFLWRLDFDLINQILALLKLQLTMMKLFRMVEMFPSTLLF